MRGGNKLPHMGNGIWQESNKNKETMSHFLQSFTSQMQIIDC